MAKNNKKKKQFNAAKERSSKNGKTDVDVFETSKVTTFCMEEKAGIIGKREFVITNIAGEILYTAKK